MNHLMDIGHENIRDYILDECSTEQLEKIEKLQNDNPTLTQLITIIDELKQKSKPDIKDTTGDIPESFSEIESIILEIQSGNSDESFAQNFLRWLAQSPTFFEKLITKLDQVSMMQVESDLPELQEVAFKTDDELLEQAGILTKKSKREKFSLFELINNLIDNIKSWFQVKPKLAYSLSTAVITFLIIVIAFNPPEQQDPFESYRYADKVPYEYDISSFRGQTVDLGIDQTLETFKNNFKLGISDYMLCDYENAIKTWEALKPTADGLENISPNDNSIPWIREYYFYLGISYLALGSNHDFKLSKRKINLNKSIDYLLYSMRIVTKYNLKKIDRENYFIGIAYGLNGNLDLAIIYLKAIDSSSKHYKKSKSLLDKIKY